MVLYDYHIKFKINKKVIKISTNIKLVIIVKRLFVLNFFMYKSKNPIQTIEDFTKLVREIEAVKNYKAELEAAFN